MVSADPKLLLKVAVIEDSWLLQQTIGTMLGELDRVEVVGGAVDERSAIELLQSQRPDLAIVDLQLQTGSGFGVLLAIYRNPERFGSPHAVVFSHHGQAEVRKRCFALGVERFFDKATQVSELITYVRQMRPS